MNHVKSALLRHLCQLPRALIFTAIFFGIPLGLVFFGLQQWYEEKAHRMQRFLIQDLDTYLAGWADEHPYLSHLEQVLRREGNRALADPDQPQALSFFVENMRRRFPQSFHFVFLSGRGELRPELSDFQPSAALLQQFYRDYALLSQKVSEPMTKNINLYRGFLGPMIGRDKEVKVYNKLLIASQREKHAYVYLSPISSVGMFLVFIDRHARLEETCLRDITRTHQQANPTWVFRLIDLKQPENSVGNVSAELSNICDSVLARLESGAEPYRLQNGYLWASLPLLGTFRLLFGIPDASQPWLAERLSRLQQALSLLFVLLFLVVWFFASTDSPTAFSIRRKLILLFTYLVGTPLLLMAISAHGFIRDRRAVLENQLFQQQEELLNAFDRGYPESNGRFERELQSLLHPPLQVGDPAADIRRRFLEINRLYQPVMGEVFDDQGRSKFQLETTWVGVTRRVISGIQGATVNLLRDINHEPLQDKVSAKEQLINMTAEFLGFNMEMIMAGFSQNLGCLREFGVSKGTIQIMMTPLFNVKGKAEYLSLLAWQNEMLEARHVQAQVASYSSLMPHSVLFAYNSERERCFPKDFADYDLARTFLIHLENRESSLKHLIASSQGNRYLCAMNGRFLKNYCLFVITEDDAIRRELQRFMIGYLCLSLVVLMLSLLAGRALARQFLVPVRQFENGLQAIAERRFDHRIPLMNRDEFGMLADMFNFMLEGLEELEVAKVVQETFFPQTTLACGDWEIHGSSIAASRVGGDYFDYFPIGEDRIGMLIGDVSGHGVGAALVVAMAKALLCHPKTESDPQKVLQTVQHVMLKTLKRKKIMTCFFAVFHPSTGLLSAANAGHCFPFIVRSNSVERIELPGSPLGTRICRVDAPVQRTLAGHDFVVLFTDGLVEAQDRSGAMIGEARIAAVLEQLRGDTAHTTVTNLMNWHAEQTGGRHPPEDDVTLVVLQKKSPVEKVPSTPTG